jgi:peptidoglycan/LPS O-acetylase OafA/YrhL
MPSLDGVRGLAILLILLLHFVANMQATNGLERLVMRTLDFGILGVDLFFVLSGFLITGILVDSKGSDGFFQNFYARRTLRIFPLYYAVLFILIVVLPRIPPFAGPELDFLRAEQAWAWFYGVNVFAALRGALEMPYIDHFWSLAVEEHFYLFWPLLVFACSQKTLLKVSAGLSVGALAARFAASFAHVNPVAIYVLTPYRLDALCIGGFLAVYARQPGGLDRLVRYAKPAAIVTLLLNASTYAAVKINHDVFDSVRQFRPTLFAMLFALLIVAAIVSPPGTVVNRFFGPELRLLGKYSYGLYVFHHFFSYYFVHHRTEWVVTSWVGSHTLAVALQAIAGSVGAFGVAFASYHLFEKRFLVLKRYWESRPRAAS